MARKEKFTVDYFPFFAGDGRTLYILKKRYGLAGIGFFTELMRLFAKTPGHVIRLDNEIDRERIVDLFCVSEGEVFDFLDLMALSGKIEKDLWEEKRIIVSEDFLESVTDAYRRRSSGPPSIDALREEYFQAEDCDYDPRKKEEPAPVVDPPQTKVVKPMTETPQPMKTMKTVKNQEPVVGNLALVVDEVRTPLVQDASPEELKAAVESRFLQEQINGEFAPGTWPRERMAIKGLVKKAQAVCPEDPGGFLEGMICQFQDLQREDQFFRKQPFLPSMLNSGGIWAQVLQAGKNRHDDRPDHFSWRDAPAEKKGLF
jgi:hypothetical protein